MLGAGLPRPQALYPNLPAGQAVQFAGIPIDLAAGAAVYIPSGYFYVAPGLYSQLQYLDPVSGLWLQYGTWDRGEPMFVSSDGASWRVWNPTGCPIGALVTNVGSGYIQSTTVVTASAGGSIWAAIVGGAISQTVTIGAVGGVTGGTNFTYAPILVASAPPAGGINATATCTVSSGAINSVTVLNQGAGYTSAPTWQVIPNPFDPNIGIITVPPLTSTLVGAGQVAAVVCTTFGLPQTTPPSLTISGAGTSATATPIMAMTITGVSMSNAGATVPGTNVFIDAISGMVTSAAGAIVNPAISTGLLVPRRPTITAPISGGVVGTPVIIDGGLFQIAPTPFVASASGTSNAGTAPAATLTMGGTTDRVFITNLGPLY